MVRPVECRSLRALVRAAVLLALVALQTARVPTQSTVTTYGVYDIGTLGGNEAEGFGVSELGYALVGRAQTESGAHHAFVEGWSGEKDLGTLGGADSIALAAYGGEIVGRARTASGQEHAFRADTYTTNPMVDLGTLGGTWSSAFDVRFGMVVGSSRVAGDARLQAFSHQNGAMTPLPVNSAGDNEARGVNNNGDVVGYACTAGNASCEAFLFSGGQVTNLGALGGRSVANKINDALQIVGTSWLADQTTRHAFIHQGGVMTDLETLGGASSEGLGINMYGDVVGWAEDGAGAARAFLWRNGTMTDLNSLLPAGSGWVLTSASGISDGGQIVGTGTLNGVKRAFLLTPPTDLGVFLGGVRSQMDGNLPRGAEVGKTIRFVISIQALATEPITVYDSRLTDTLTGPAEYVSAQSFFDDAECQVTPKVVTCDFAPVDSPGIGREVLLTIKTTAPGDISHTAVVTSGAPDPRSSNDSATDNNWAVALASLALTPQAVPGGKISTARVTVTPRPPAGDAVVRMTSSRPDVAPVPETFVVPSWTDKREFHIVPRVVAEPTTVEITATYGLVSQTQTLTILPPALSQLYLTPTTIIGGCGTSAGKIVLTGAAPAAGAVVALSNTNADAIVPASITVDEDLIAKTFTITTNTVTTSSTGSVTANYGGASQTLALTVRPIRARTLTLSPNPVKGGSTVTGTVTLECPAAPGAVVVGLSSGNPAVAAPVQSSVTIPAGASTGSFSIDTSAVTANSGVTIYATVFGSRKGATLTVTP